MKKPKKIKKQKLTFRELLDFIKGQDRFFRRHAPHANEEIRLLSRTVKLAEETGELASAVLASLGDQRNAKLKKHKASDLGEEIADVIITVLVVAEALHIDAREPLLSKMEKIKKRIKNW